MIEAGNIRELDKSISQVFDKIKQLTFFYTLSILVKSIIGILLYVCLLDKRKAILYLLMSYMIRQAIIGYWYLCKSLNYSFFQKQVFRLFRKLGFNKERKNWLFFAIMSHIYFLFYIRNLNSCRNIHEMYQCQLMNLPLL